MAPTESKPRPSPSLSGKLLIIGILAIAFAAAGTSWWFRYSATHRAATFWGPATAALIRDARVIQLWLPTDPHENVRSASLAVSSSDLHDISSARGLVHLRNALLEDHSFNWPTTKISPDVQWTQGLRFLDSGTGVLLMFSSDFNFVRTPNGNRMLSCEPMAKGLREMFAEFSGASTIGKPGPAAEGPPAPIAPAPSASPPPAESAR
jgi:hypothetical protein